MATVYETGAMHWAGRGFETGYAELVARVDKEIRGKGKKDQI
jgi:hypothetical protein